MLRRRREPVPFAFIAEADAFRSDVPPPRERATPGQIAGRALVGVLVVAGLVGSVIFGLPALQISEDHGSAQITDTVRD